MVVNFAIAPPERDEPQGLSAAFGATRDRSVVTALWLTALAGMAFGVLDVLAPLRLSQLGATPIVIGGTFLAAAALETGLSPLTGRLSDRSGPYLPVRISLAAGVLVSLLAPLLAPAPVLIMLLITGMPGLRRAVRSGHRHAQRRRAPA